LMAGQGLLSVDLARGLSTTFNFSSSDTSELTVPATVVLPANATSVAFNLTAVDDALLDGTKNVTITAGATGYNTTNVQVSVHDNEIAVLSVSAPSNVVEGVNVASIVVMNAPAGDTVTVNLSSSDPTQLQVPASVTIFAGQTSNTFTIT